MRQLINAVTEAAEKSKKKKAATAYSESKSTSRFLLIKHTIIGEPLNFVVPTNERYFSNGLSPTGLNPSKKSGSKGSKSKSK